METKQLNEMDLILKGVRCPLCGGKAFIINDIHHPTYEIDCGDCEETFYWDRLDHTISHYTDEEIKEANEAISKRLWTIYYPDGKRVIMDKETKTKYSIEIE